MSETTIQITVTGDNAAETVERITAQFPDDATVSVGEPPVAPASDGDALIQQAIAASAELPDRVNAWFEAFDATSSMGIFGVSLIILAIIASVWALDRVLP